MTLVMRCDEKERLVGYLYDEVSADERAAVEAHLARCAACAAELGELRGVRVRLEEWEAPGVELGFRITREPAPRRAWGTLPTWVQAAAAVIVLSAGAALSNLEIRYGQDGFTVRTGWGAPPGRSAATAPSAQPHADAAAARPLDAASRGDLTALEERLRGEIARNRRTATAPVPDSVDTREVLQQVRALVDESERRQQKELAFRLAQVVRDIESQRRADLVRIEQNMGQIEGLTGQEVVRQRDMLNYLMRVSSQRPVNPDGR